MGVRLVNDQSDQQTPHSITLEEEAVDNNPVLPTTNQGPVIGLSVMGSVGPFEGVMMEKSGGADVVKTASCVISPTDTQKLGGEMTDGEIYRSFSHPHRAIYEESEA